MENADQNKPLFRDIAADEDDPEIMQIESLCMNCKEQGLTKLFLTRIPFFKEVIVSSFTCDHCGMKNAELQPGGKIQAQGLRIKVLIKDEEDLNRQVVQTQYATVSIPSLGFEIPPNKGVLTTVEGILDKSIDGLRQDQPQRRIEHPEIAAKIDEFLVKLTRLKLLGETFELVLNDPSGNSFIENPHAPKPDENQSIEHYDRTKEQNELLGLAENTQEEDDTAGKQGETTEGQEEQGETTEEDAVTNKMEKIKIGEKLFDAKDEVVTFPTNCPHCNSPADTHMKAVDIPHFKEVIIMATTCDRCGFRDNEVKSGAGIEDKGKKITLHITDPSDLTRDVLKSETAGIAIPELEFLTESGTLGGRFTTLEGLLVNVKEQLVEDNPFLYGDSSSHESKTKLAEFCGKIQEIIDGKLLNVHFILDDPAGNSFLQNFYAPEDDPEMEVLFYKRNFEQNEVLGLNDIKTENYEES